MQSVQEKIQTHFLMPSTLFVSVKPMKIQTVLGSCVAVCIYDQKRGFGGMNHFKLPIWKNEGLATPKYGNIAIPKLIDKMIRLNSHKKDLVAKLFGGSNHLFEKNIYEIGQRNVELAYKLLDNEGIPIIAKDVGGKTSRKIFMDTQSNIIQLKRF